ncbi:MULTISPECIES: hypothetical protein [unclassified Iodidimonas]|jgi:P pilus assembly chaperone PapD|uniref:fimbrial biogenesis chaperone n=1 Tax=unclassified Iodidimonas TaxID=2626145 RepID=UPI0024823EEF|nr:MULTISPECIES: hypothetical protein [unclassified Iodidimonas]
MKFFLNCLTFLGFFSFLLLATPGHAQGVSAFPQRVELSPENRIATVTLFNRGTERSTYRISFINYRQGHDGKMEAIDTPPEGEGFADGMIRFSPRQVILPPGEPQTVRLMLRTPPDLAEGEYRSHLMLQSIPPSEPIDPDPDPEELSVSLNIVYGFSIPIFVQVGELSIAGRIEPAGFDAQGQPIIRIYNEGSRHLRADLVVLSRTSEVTRINGLAVYLSTGYLDFPIDLSSLAPELKNTPLTLELRMLDDGPVLSQTQISVP